MENKQVINEGLALRNYLKGSGKEMGEIAEMLKMSRQNLNHHLRKPILEGNFSKLVELVFEIDLEKDIFSKLKMTETETPARKGQFPALSLEQLLELNRVKGNIQEDEVVYEKTTDEAIFDDIVNRHKERFKLDNLTKIEQQAYRYLHSKEATQEQLWTYVLSTLDNLQNTVKTR